MKIQAVTAYRAVRRRRLVRYLSLVAAVSLIAAACSSGGGEAADEASEDTTGAAGDEASTVEAEGAAESSEPAGEPIKIMTVTTLNANAPTYQNIANTAFAYADYINARGGINGRPLEVMVCDEQFDPAVAASCARQAVEEGVISVVGSFTFFADGIVPVIAESDITWFGACCPVGGSEFTSAHSFPIGNQPMYGVGAVKRAVEDGCTSINAGIVEGGEAFVPFMENAIGALGQSFGTIETIPAVSQDYSALVAQVANGADCAIIILNETPFISWNTAWAQSGTDVVQYAPQGNLNEISAAGNEEATNGDVIAGMFPDLTTEPWDEFRTALDEAGLDLSEQDYNSLGGMGTWAAYTAFTQIAETIEGEVTAESFFEAASNTSNLDLNGMIPVLDFTQEWDVPGVNRLFNRSVIFSQLDNGKVIPLTSEFEDVTSLALGIAE